MTGLPEEGVFKVKVKTGCSSTAFDGYDELASAFLFSLSARPEKGLANKELLSFLKKEHGLSCELISGRTSRKKLLRVLSRKT